MSSPTEFNSATDQFVDSLGSNIIESTTKAATAAAENNTATDQNVNNDNNDNGNEIHEERDGQPPQGLIFQGMSFYVNRDSSANDSADDVDRLHQLIESHGGNVLHQMPIKELMRPNVFIISPYNDTRLPTVNPTYIRACCQNETLLDIGNYLVPFDEYRSVIDTELQDEQNRNHQQQQEQRDEENESRSQQVPDQGQIMGGAVNAKPAFQAQDPQDIQGEQQIGQRNHEEDIQEDEEGERQPLAEIEEKVRANEESSGGVEVENEYDSSSRSMLARSNLASHNKASFTEQEDEFILDVVRKNPTRRTTHTLYDEISHYVPNHTGNSIRHRFRVYLSKRLEYVYEVDKDGKLIRDASGNLVHTKVLPPSIKKKFTAEEDYQLAIGIKKQFYRDLYQIDPDTGVSLISDEDSPTAIAKRNMTMDPNHVPGTEPNFQDYRVSDRRGPIAREFFKHFGDSYPTHTENAWRDRFRKFLLSYGIDNYIYYYEKELGHGHDPEPMKNLTNRIKRPGIPTPGNYNSAAKKARFPSTDSRSGASSPSSNGDGSGGNNSATVAAAAAAAAAMAAAQNNNVDANNAAAAAAAAAGASVPSNHYTIPENEFLDEDTINFLTNLRTDLNKDESNVPFEYPQEIAEAIRNDFSNEEAHFDNIDPDYIPFPPQVASIDLFLPQFFNMRSTREFMEKIHEVISREYEPSQAEKLVQDLCDEAGVRKTFSTSILTALSGDLMVFPRYFLNMFKYNVNPPPSVPGIWTREDDRMLISNKDEDLRILTKKHGTGRIEMRRKFVEKELI